VDGNVAVRIVKLVVAVPLVGIAAFFAWYGAFIISKVFAEYKDSSDATYVTIGGASLAISALFATAALLTVSQARRRWGWLALAVLAGLASVLPYTAMVGGVGYGLHAILGLLAVSSLFAYLVGVVHVQRAGRT
jgi:hypothetical protein